MKLKLILFSSVFIAVGCSTTTKFGDRDLPEWVVDESLIKSSPNELTAIGMSDGLNNNLRMNIAQAEADARANLAQKILSNVSRKVDDIISQSVNSSACQLDKNKKESCKSEHYSSFKQQSEIAVRDVKITNTSRRHIATSNNVIYVAIAMNKEVAEKQIQEAFNNLSSNDKKNSSLYQSLTNELKNSDLSNNTLEKKSDL